MAEPLHRNIVVQGFSHGANTNVCYRCQLTLKNSDGTLMNIEDATASWRAKRSYGAGLPIIQLSETDGITVDVPTSTFTIEITNGHMLAVDLTKEETELSYDVDVVVDGFQRRVVYGNVKIRGDL